MKSFLWRRNCLQSGMKTKVPFWITWKWYCSAFTGLFASWLSFSFFVKINFFAVFLVSPRDDAESITTLLQRPQCLSFSSRTHRWYFVYIAKGTEIEDCKGLENNEKENYPWILWAALFINCPKFNTRENLNIEKSMNQPSSWRLKQQDLLSRELPEIFLSIFHVCVPNPTVPQQEI